MFRFTIRDLLLVTALVGLSIAWWLDHQTIATANAEAMAAKMQAVAAKEEAAEDARALARYSIDGCRCGNELMGFAMLQEKYGAKRMVFDFQLPDVASPVRNP